MTEDNPSTPKELLDGLVKEAGKVFKRNTQLEVIKQRVTDSMNRTSGQISSTTSGDTEPEDET